MVKAVTFLLFLAFLFKFSQAKSIIPQPQQFRSFKINNTQNVKSCSYTVSITTSCSSTKYTRDQISLAFGDAYGNQMRVSSTDKVSYLPIKYFGFESRIYQKSILVLIDDKEQSRQVYAPRLDDPSTRTFERCSRDTFQILGPCSYQICYVYLYRSGFDGWMPEKVTIYGYNTKSATFYYNTYIPNDVWYGFNLCNGASVSTM